MPSSQVVALDRSHAQAVQRFADACEGASTDVTTVWREVMGRFLSASASIEVEHSGLARADSPLFAILEEDGIRAMAHYSMWATDAASIGVLTHPAYRRRGHGRTAVIAAMSDAFAHGHLVLYRTLLANRASVALAASLGVQDYGRFLAVHLARA